MRKNRKRWLFGAALIVFFLCRILIFSPVMVSGVSMEPTLCDGNVLWIKKFDVLSVDRLDIVVVNIDGKHYIKRVIGLPGETLLVHENGVLVDGTPCADPYYRNDNSCGTGRVITLGRDEIFVVGDNRNNSIDSRTFGAVKYEQVEGIAFLIIFPKFDLLWN